RQLPSNTTPDGLLPHDIITYGRVRRPPHTINHTNSVRTVTPGAVSQRLTLSNTMESGCFLTVIQTTAIKELPKFTGELTQKIPQFIHAIEQIRNFTELNDSLLHSIATIKLGAAAFNWYDNNKQTLRTWPDLKQHLLERFTPSLSAAKIQLKERKQQPGETLLAYYDDVIDLCKQVDSNMPLHMIVDHLQDGIRNELTVHVKRQLKNKCTIATDSIVYLEHAIRNNELRPINDYIRGLLQTPPPKASKEIFRFLKAADYYRKFIQNFSTIAAPLYKYNPSTTRTTAVRSKKFYFSSVEEFAFEQLKQILTTDVVLRLPNNQLLFKVQTDASHQGIGAVLLQAYPEGDRPVCYMSKKFTPTQQRWSPIEQERYAIVKAIEQWDHYLHGNRFVLESDHKPLEALAQKIQLNDKCERWRLKLQTYDITVKHIKGSFNSMPDYLSQSPVDEPEEDSDGRGCGVWV
ncbi:unnamed protein product, partial [Rotaria sp. Silwood2]